MGSTRWLKVSLCLSLLVNTLLLGGIGIFLGYRPRASYVLQTLAFNLVNHRVERADPFPESSCGKWPRTKITEPGEIIFLGDSLTGNLPLNTLFPQDRVRNEGISGDWTDCVLYRLPAILAGKPKALFLMVGINDLDEGRSASLVLESYTRILYTVRSISPETKVFIQSILPINERIYSTTITPQLILETNRLLRHLAQEFGYTYVDIHPHLADRSGRLEPRFTSDGVHLNPLGNQKWTEHLQTLPPLPGTHNQRS